MLKSYEYLNIGNIKRGTRIKINYENWKLTLIFMQINYSKWLKH